MGEAQDDKTLQTLRGALTGRYTFERLLGEGAINTALHWVQADPSAGPAYEALATAYAAARRYDEAIATLERAMRQPASRHADFPYRIASYMLPSRPNEALTALREAMRTYGPDSLMLRGSASRLQALLAAANVAMLGGAMGDMDRLFGIATTVDPVVPGTQRAGRAVPTTSQTGPFRVAVRTMAGVGGAGDRRIIDSAIARIDAMPQPASARIRQTSWGLAYGGYIITQDPKYLDIIRRWSGQEIPLVLQAVAALREGDTAKAARLAAQFPPPDTARLTSTPNEIDDPLTRAFVLNAVGQPRAALAVLESIDPKRLTVLELDPRWAMYARSLIERGLLYEELGDRAKAVAAYDRYIEVMRNSDAVFQPQMKVARGRLQELRDAPATPLPPR